MPEYRRKWVSIYEEVALSDIDNLPPPKIFKPKNSLPVLDSYEGEAPGWFWAQFPVNLVEPAKSLVDGDLLKDMALSHGFKDLRLRTIWKGS